MDATRALLKDFGGPAGEMRKKRILVVLSGVHDVRQQVADLPVEGHIAKPFDDDDLRACLERFLSSSDSKGP